MKAQRSLALMALALGTRRRIMKTWMVMGTSISFSTS